jgi:alanyl-tRNA synthetase
MQADILREKFLNFFKSRKHKLVESDSLAPKDDPTVLFTPAGMNQFKKEFMGYDSGFSRAATSQRCLRTDDLDKVGKTSGHHTFFEMLGNFSFGDYFKKEAIAWSWEFLTQELKINRDRLWVSVYRDDEEAYKIWLDIIKVDAGRILKLGDKENFWPSEAKEKGPNGPCGPCSEIFFDRGRDKGCGQGSCTPACGCGRFVEVWNLVFTQFNRKDNGVLEPLPNKNIDTGMGFERLAAVMQGADNNFETDLFVSIIKEINLAMPDQSRASKPLVYAVADHIRAIVFSIYDGILPSNEARGYVVRKLIRKSVLHLRALGINEVFLNRLVPVVAQAMRSYYPELKKRQENIAEIILVEEKNFISALNSSEALFRDKFHGFLEKQDPEIVGKITFQLYDTYGMPLELTQSWLEKHGINISMQAFNAELSEQKSRSKLQSAMKGDVFSSREVDYGTKETRFLGYAKLVTEARILRLVKSGQKASRITRGEEAVMIADKTTFYPEGGGQVADTGEAVKGKNIFEVQGVKKAGNVILHIGIVKQGSFKVGDEVSLNVSGARRLAIARNHTATHILQAGLRKILGPHVEQQGSLVAQDKLRFDFTHFKDIDSQQLARVEEFVNTVILDNIPIKIKESTPVQAKKAGALAFFGEKYGSKVRVVSIPGTSMELCAGTHLQATGQIGIFKIVQEGSVASGVRRIEAVTGTGAYKIIKEEEAVVAELTGLLGVPRDRVISEIEKRTGRLKELEKQLNTQMVDALKNSLDDIIRVAEEVKGARVIIKALSNMDMELLRKNVDLIKEKCDNSVVALASNTKGRGLLVIGVSPSLTGRVDAGRLIRDVSGIIGGSGGGRPDFAQAGGNKPQGIPEALAEIKTRISNLL